MRFGFREAVATALIFTPVRALAQQLAAPVQHNGDTGLTPYSNHQADMDLFWAEATSIETVRDLMDTGCEVRDIDKLNKNGHSALFVIMHNIFKDKNRIADKKDIKLIEKMLEKGADVNTRYIFNIMHSYTPFELAILSGDMRIFRLMKPKATPTTEALHLAMSSSQDRMMEELIQDGAPINSAETRKLLAKLPQETNDSFRKAALKRLSNSCQAAPENTALTTTRKPGL